MSRRVIWAIDSDPILQLHESCGRSALATVREAESKLGILLTTDSLRAHLRYLKLKRSSSPSSVTAPPIAQPPPSAEPPPPPPSQESPRPGSATWPGDPAPSTVVSLPEVEECRLLWTSDIHFRYHLEKETDLLTKVISDYRPDLLVLGGDIFDMHLLSKFPADPRRSQDWLQYEFDIGRPYIEEWMRWAKETVFIEGNHEARLRKIVASLTPGLTHLDALLLKKAAKLPDSLKYYPFLTKLRLGPLFLFHGTSAVQYTAAKYLREWHVNAICGHTHRPEIRFHNYMGEQKVVAVSGCLQDPAKAWYVDHPSWTPGFVTATVYTTRPGEQAVHIEPHNFYQGTVWANGRVYR